MLKIILAFILFVTVMSMGRSAEFKVNYIKLNKFTTQQTTNINKTAKVIETVLNSQEFKDYVIGHTYQGQRQFVDTTMNNEQVYATIMAGAEKFYMPVANGNMDIGLQYYYSWKKTIGYTHEKSDTVWLNRKYHDKYTEYDQGCNLVHEWTHKLGFKHAQKWSKSRDYSVPYAVGTIVDRLSKVLKENPKGLRPVVK